MPAVRAILCSGSRCVPEVWLVVCQNGIRLGETKQSTALPRRPKEEAEHLPVVGRCRSDGESEVERQRSWAHRRNVDAEAKTWSNAELVGMQSDVFLDRAKVHKERAADHVVGRQRIVVLGGVEPLEPATDGDA